MPRYVFKCDECSKQFDLNRKVAQRSNQAKCPHCGSENVRRRFSSVGIKRGDSGAVSLQNVEVGDQQEDSPWPAAFMAAHRTTIGKLEIRGGWPVGFVAPPGSEVKGENVSIGGAKIGIDVNDSKVEIKELEIEGEG